MSVFRIESTPCSHSTPRQLFPRLQLTDSSTNAQSRFRRNTLKLPFRCTLASRYGSLNFWGIVNVWPDIEVWLSMRKRWRCPAIKNWSQNRNSQQEYLELSDTRFEHQFGRLRSPALLLLWGTAQCPSATIALFEKQWNTFVCESIRTEPHRRNLCRFRNSDDLSFGDCMLKDQGQLEFFAKFQMFHDVSARFLWAAEESLKWKVVAAELGGVSRTTGNTTRCLEFRLGVDVGNISAVLFATKMHSFLGSDHEKRFW